MKTTEIKMKPICQSQTEVDIRNDDTINDESEPKRQRLNDEILQIDLVTKDAPVLKANPPFFKLHLNACDEIFDLLSLKDLRSFSETCKGLQQIAGLYFQQYYRAIRVQTTDNAFKYRAVELNGFSDYIGRIELGNRMEQFQFGGMNCNKNLTHICFNRVTFTESKIECIKVALGTVKDIRMHGCRLNGDLYEELLQFCPTLKCLSIIFSQMTDKFLVRKYSTLQHLQILTQSRAPCKNLKIFFEINPNVRNFSTYLDYLRLNESVLLQAKVQLNSLHILVRGEFNDAAQFFVDLHKCDFYKRLEISLNDFICSQKTLEPLQFIPALAGLQLIMIDDSAVNILRTLTGLQKLEMYDIRGVSVDQVEILAKSLVNLTRLDFSFAPLSQLMPFIRYATQLKEINLLNENYHLNLFKLNEEREKLAGAQRLTIYLKEDAFLATKWVMKGINFDLVEVRRAESKEFKYLRTNNSFHVLPHWCMQ